MRIALLGVVLLASVASADDLKPKDFDPARCLKEDAPQQAPVEENLTPITWADFELTGKFLDNAKTVRSLMEPTMKRHRALTSDSRADIKRAANAFGYHVVGIFTRETKDGTHVVVHLEPLPIVRVVDVDPGVPWYGAVIGNVRLVHDDVRRRMRMRTGSYLPWDPNERECEIEREKARAIEYLQDEGYFDAKVDIKRRFTGNGLVVEVTLDLGSPYKADTNRITVPGSDALYVKLSDIRKQFEHKGQCVIGEEYFCYGDPRFTRGQHQADLIKVAKVFKQRGFPAVRVTSDFTPERSIDRRTKTVRFTVTIDQRRRLQTFFFGFDPDTIKEEDLRKQLTFNDASSSDEVEAEASAKAIAAFLQTKGFFDARVTFESNRFSVNEKESIDKIVFHIDQGKRRSVNQVDLVGVRALKEGDVREVMGTKTAKLSKSLFGGSTSATSELFGGDVSRIVDLYRRNGYRQARVRVTASPVAGSDDSAALTAALVSASRGDGLYVRFTIDEGQPTLVTQVHVLIGDTGDTITNENRALCEQTLKDLAEFYKHPPLATPVNKDRCIGIAKDLPFREDEAADTDDRLKDKLFSRGRPRAEVAYEPQELGPRRIAAKYTVKNIQELKVGKIVIRGNFKTSSSIIRNELGLKEGAVLTSDKLAEGARKLRNTALFDSVAISMPDLATTGAGNVNAVVEVTERYDYTMGGTFEIGYSSFNGAFLKVAPSLPNLFGSGVTLDLSGTVGFELQPAVEDQEGKLRQLAAEGTLRFPKFIPRQLGIPLEFQTDINAFFRRQETERFGLLRTTGATLNFSKKLSDRPRRENTPARAITLGIHYDYRSRERNVDALRPIGADDDDSQVPITTITGSVGVTFEWEQRVDRNGTLSPLLPEAGFRLDGEASYAHPALLSQDKFLKLKGAVSKFWPITENVVLRSDIRYDQGFPNFTLRTPLKILGYDDDQAPALLPEVERFFGGGDSSVRGYADERLATELIQIGVPPLSNISQIRVLPAGGNIRVIGSLDVQYRVWSTPIGWLATGVFFDAGMIKNQWGSVTEDDVRPSVGMTLFRMVTPFGTFTWERGIPLKPRLGDDPRGRWHINFAARAQF